jgi:hypothetical protein
MLAEFGFLGAALVMFLIVLQMFQSFPGQEVAFAIGGAVVAIAFGAYTRSLGNPLLFVLALIMVPLATTEIGTDGWIEEIMKSIASINGFDAGLVLVYTSAIMMVLRFFAGPIVHRISPIGLLIMSSVLAIVGLYWLSFAEGMVVFAAASIYAVGKTFFWPTMLGVAGEQTPRGGALTLNALGGIGMLGVGVLGFPYIGMLQSQKTIDAVASSADIIAAAPALADGGNLSVLEEKDIYSIIKYKAISDDKVTEALSNLSEEKATEVKTKMTEVSEASVQGALASMCVFPIVMLISYIGLGLFFKSRGGYKVKTLED